MGSAATQFHFSKETAQTSACDVVIVPVFEPEGKAELVSGELKTLDKAMQGMIGTGAKDEEFKGGAKSLMMLRKTPADNIKAKRLIILGLGKKEKLDLKTFETCCVKAFGAADGLKPLGSVAFCLPPATQTLTHDQLVGSIVDAAYQMTYRSQEASKPGTNLKTVHLLGVTTPSASFKAALKTAEVMATARSHVKDLVNKPSNLKRTDTLADFAKSLGKLTHLKATVKTDVKWIEKTMPCFYEVARGSVASDPPKWITVEYTPPSAATASKKKGKAPKKIALVGKGVIFDTGGYQVKTGNYMNTMKGDMTGSACVLAAMQAIATLKPSVAVTAYVAATPNKIDSDAMIPDTIVSTTCGKKVEIRHTDAEGRLTLIDAVTMAERDKPDAIITIATLTGSASQAVGVRMALMGNNEPLRNQVEAAARSVGDPVQPLDVDDDDYDNIKSKLDGADIRNTNKGTGRGAQTAAAFVMSGAADTMPIAHLDIAGADMTSDEKATGIGVKTLIQFVLNQQ